MTATTLVPRKKSATCPRCGGDAHLATTTWFAPRWVSEPALLCHSCGWTPDSQTGPVCAWCNYPREADCNFMSSGCCSRNCYREWLVRQRSKLPIDGRVRLWRSA